MNDDFDDSQIIEDEFGFKRRLENGKTISLIPQIFNFRLCIGWTHNEDSGYDDFYCYKNFLTAWLAFVEWNGVDDPLQGWHRHGASGRRRTDGDPEQEYIQH